ncbi:MAG: hypothetical protein U0892_14855 [Pirellulales bacterium]
MARRDTEHANVGEDSFLDTIANLVGILIIIVVIVATKTKANAETTIKEIQSQDITQAVSDPAQEALRMRDALAQDVAKLQQYALETEYRRLERDKLLAQVALAREAVQEEIAAFDEKEKEEIEKTQELERLESELKNVSEQIGAAEATKRPKVVLEHLPTPMAKTVFGKELHIRVKDGLVTVIPWDRLVETLKQHAPVAARRNSSKQTMEDRIGPVGGFMLHYWMTAIPGGFELDRFEIDPTPENRGETVEETLASGGRLRGELAARVAAETVVTIWVYPDSFAELRKLKTVLFREGFLAAARPLPDGILIGASPKGSRSAAQ